MDDWNRGVGTTASRSVDNFSGSDAVSEFAWIRAERSGRRNSRTLRGSFDHWFSSQPRLVQARVSSERMAATPVTDALSIVAHLHTSLRTLPPQPASRRRSALQELCCCNRTRCQHWCHATCSAASLEDRLAPLWGCSPGLSEDVPEIVVSQCTVRLQHSAVYSSPRDCRCVSTVLATMVKYEVSVTRPRCWSRLLQSWDVVWHDLLSSAVRATSLPLQHCRRPQVLRLLDEWFGDAMFGIAQHLWVARSRVPNSPISPADRRRFNRWLQIANQVRVRIWVAQLVTQCLTGCSDFMLPGGRANQLLRKLQSVGTALLRPPSNRNPLATVVHPCTVRRGTENSVGWVYSWEGRHKCDSYVGSTSRKRPGTSQPLHGQTPHDRWQEHWRSAVQVFAGRHISSALPFYRRMRLRRQGIFSGIFWPMFSIDVEQHRSGFGTRQDSRPGSERRKLPVVLRVRSAEAMVIQWFRPGLNTPFVLALSNAARNFGGYAAVTSRACTRTLGRTDAAPSGPRCGSGDGGIDRIRLVDRVSGVVWEQGKRWSAQFQAGRLVVDPESWNAESVLNLVIRLTRHAKQARSSYAVLRRLSPAQVQQLLKVAQDCNPRWEQLVWTHVQRLRRADLSGLRLQRVVLQDMCCVQGSLRDWVTWFLSVLEHGGYPHPGIVKFRAFRGRPVKKVLVNETFWKKRFAQTRVPVRCTCHVLASSVGHRQHLISVSDTYGEQHYWTTWTALLTRDEALPYRTDPVTRMQSMLASLCPATAVGHQFPFPATTALAEDRSSVVTNIRKAALRVLRSYPGGRQYLSAVGAPVVSEAIDRWSSDWLARTPVCDGQAGQANSLLTRQWLSAVWKSARKDLLVTNLDKRAADLRLSCPRLGQLEVLHDVRRYFSSLCDVTAQAMTAGIVQTWTEALASYCDNDCAGVDKPSGEVPMPRALPKGKDPGRKARLLVDYSVSPASDLHRMASRAMDWVVTSVLKSLGFCDFSVCSMAAVQQKLLEAETAIASPSAGSLLVVRKSDFVAFFLEVSRDQCLQSARSWCQKLQQLSDRSAWIRVKDVEWTAQDKEVGFKGIPGEGDVCQLLRRPVHSPGWSGFRVLKLPEVLRLDFESLLQADRCIWKQSRGIPMGSPWGTVACRSWACLREFQFRHLLLLARQLDTDCRRTLTAAPWSPMRWVDDRWWVLRCSNMAVARAVTAADALTYSNVAVGIAHALTIIAARHDSWTLDFTFLFVKQVAGWLSYSVDQTSEDPSSVVGIDVAFCDAVDGKLVHETDAGGLSKGLQEAVWIGDRRLQMLSRLTTKNPGLLSDDWVVAARPQPRFAARATDLRSIPERTAALMGWVTRLADCAYAFADCCMPVTQRHQPLSNGSKHPWQMAAVDGVIRELLLSGWDRSTCLRACERVLASSLMRDPTSLVLHRISVVRQLRAHVATAWEHHARVLRAATP